MLAVARSLSLALALASAPAGALELPADLGKHDGVKMESWMVYAHLRGADGRELGLSVSIFEGDMFVIHGRAVWVTLHRKETPGVELRYDVLLPLLDDVEHAYGRTDERFGESRLWCEARGPCRLTAKVEDLSLDLTLAGGKPALPLADQGAVAWEGHRSWGYFVGGLVVSGSMRAAEETWTVSGEGQLQHFWSNTMEEDHDLFSLQIEGGTQIVLIARHDAAGRGPLPGSALNFSPPSGPASAPTDWTLTSSRRWTSPRSDVAYPAAWRLTIPAAGITLDLVPTKPDQEISILGMRSWIGEVTVTGTTPDGPARGTGLAMLMGYEESES